ncbi:MAG: right-handed parallel beta-helix repeat-containing protein [Flavobacteriales bacterium]|jgi:hypothetical protein|nr:right-handed parallel beta-helix repeat-containing protein [Flavobacteriales bacterium]
MRTPAAHIVTIALLLVLRTPTFAVTYYISPTGNDAHNGTSPATAWRTIDRAQQATQGMQPGDQMLFQRGGTYPGTLHLNSWATEAAPILFGAYGEGPDPIISGGVPVSGWTVYQGNIWRAPFEEAPKYLIVDGAPMTLARYPDTGWLHNVQGSNSSLSDPANLGQPDGQWNGATVVARTTNYSYEKMTVTAHANGTLTFAPIGRNFADEDWGFFIQNSLHALDAAGEWYHDAAAGQLYFRPPGDADPNTMEVLASVHAHGFVPGWQREHLIVENLVFQGQTAAGISTEVAHHVIVRHCTFRFGYKGISSTGSNNRYINNHFHDTYASAINVQVEPGTRVENNLFERIALVPGGGEDGWGYFGVTASGAGTVVRGNVMDQVGYIAIGTTANGLVERNIVRHACAILNDGAAITFDDCDGVIVRDNIVEDMVCDLTSVATEHHERYKIGFGIYFGNRVIKNTIVERNTVTRCDGAGIHVDHTKLNSGNIVRDNVLFDNAVQLSISDYSNNNTPGGSPPWYVPAFNTVYSGNVMYSIRPDQLCMRQLHVHSTEMVDFGTFTNNRYFNPYEELSISLRVLPASTTHLLTLERWQEEHGQDAGSTRSPLRLPAFEVLDVLGPENITNGQFTQDVGGWSGWPTTTEVTVDHTYLDNGAMKVHMPNNDQYDYFFLHQPQMFDVTEGAWYRLKASTQSTMHGVVTVEMKGESQITGPYSFWNKRIPFSDERRDLEMYFQSDRTEQVRTQLVNHWTEHTYWMDNISLHEVAVEPVDPYARHMLVINHQGTAQSFPLTGCWSDVDAGLHSGSITLGPFGSIVLQKEEETLCMAMDVDDPPGAATIGVYPNPVQAGGELFFRAPLQVTAEARLMDAAGRTVHQERLAPGKGHMPIAGNLPKGVYHLQLVEESGRTHAHRLVVM